MLAFLDLEVHINTLPDLEGSMWIAPLGIGILIGIVFSICWKYKGKLGKFIPWGRIHEGKKHHEEGRRYYRDKKIKEARDEYARALGDFEKAAERKLEAEVLCEMGQLELAENDSERAKQHFYQAARLYQQAGLKKHSDDAIARAQAVGRPPQGQ